MPFRNFKTFMLILVVSFAAALLAPQACAQPVTTANYKQALKFSGDNLKPFVYSTSVRPDWIGKSGVFWYSFKTNKGTHYYRIDPRKRTKEPLFDQGKLAALISETTRKPVHHARLPISRLSVTDDEAKLKFVMDGYYFEFDVKAQSLKKLGKAPKTAPIRFRGGSRERFERYKKFLEERRKRLEEEKKEEDDTDTDKDKKKDDEDTGKGKKKIGKDAGKDTKEGGKEKTKSKKGGKKGSRLSKTHAYSPDKKAYVYAEKYNLYYGESRKKKRTVQLSKDGEKDYGFGGSDKDAKVRPRVTWSKDSEAFYISRRDHRGVKELFLIDSLAEPRPKLSTYRYPMPGEEKIRRTELYVFHKKNKKLIRIEPKWKDENYINVHWGKKSDELRFIRMDRLRRNLELCTADPQTGKAKCLIPEGFENSSISYQSVRYLKDTDEMIWWSERSGWGHFYLYDRNGKLKNKITSGQFRASDIVALDEKKRLLFFRGNAREHAENVYYEHLYCVRLDGSGLTLMDPGNANHRSYLSPGRDFVVDTCSRIDMAPLSVLRDAKGNKIMDLEKTDMSRLYEMGWKMPGTFSVKAADGITDLYGNMWKPFDFDPKKKYPIIAYVYPGPQQEGVSHTFSATRSQQQLAQVGFIVIQVGHRGGTPTRDKAYQAHSYFNMRDYALEDTKCAIEQLAARHGFIDIDRVGIYGHSGGGFMSAAAMLQKPYNDFFKAAVASAGNHDNNIYNNSWAERYHGMKEVPITEAKKTKDDGKAKDKSDAKTGKKKAPVQKGKRKKGTKKIDEKKKDEKSGEEKSKPKTRFEIKVPTNAELAGNLKGALLLVHGEIDNNVHPANTMRLVDALIKANKRFDMLILPGTRHSFGRYSPYFNRRMWDFFSTHLLDDPPSGADITRRK